MSDLVERLHGEASEYEPHRVEADLFREAAERIEVLEDELADANAKIKAVRVIHHAHSVLTAECVSCRGFFPCRTIRALESATPKPTDNGEDAT